MLVEEMKEVGDYEIDPSPIGQGQFSIVYGGKVKATGLEVALKKVQIFDMKTSRARSDFLAEVEHLSKIQHPNMVRYLTSFQEEFDFYICLEWEDGGDLASLINFQRKSRKYFPESTIWNYFEQICSAIKYLHEMGLVHRDIKPANILITKDGNLKIGDLGLARYFSLQRTDYHTLIATPYYMAPERLNKEDGYGPPSDVWAMGCLLYELAMLRSPYTENMNLAQLCRLITIGNYPSVSKSLSHVMRNLIDEALMPQPEQRPSIQQMYRVSFEMKNKYTRKKHNIRKN